jgi:hypothetical protein
LWFGWKKLFEKEGEWEERENADGKVAQELLTGHKQIPIG